MGRLPWTPPEVHALFVCDCIGCAGLEYMTPEGDVNTTLPPCAGDGTDGCPCPGHAQRLTVEHVR